MSDWVRVWRKKGGGRESGGPSYDGLPEDYGIRSNGPRRNATKTVAAADPADLCPIRHIRCLSKEHDARIRDLEELLAMSIGMNVEVPVLRARIRELEERIALMEQATCDVCGHKFYALEADG